MERTTIFAWTGLSLFVVSLVLFAILTGYEMVQSSRQDDKNDLVESEPYVYQEQQGSMKPKPKKTCFPGCEKAKLNDTYKWRCSRKSMYEGGKDGGLCDNLTECREPNPSCCCYDFQCDACDEE